MKVVIPATSDRSPHLDAVREALAGVDHEVHQVHGDTGYWQLLSDLWTRTEGVILVEHDIIASPDAIAELVDCNQDWCCCAYPYGRGTIVGLGCTKLSKALMERVPDAVERAGRVTDRTHPIPGHWCRLDASLQRALVDSGERMHFEGHSTVGHLNTARSAHGCRG